MSSPNPSLPDQSERCVNILCRLKDGTDGKCPLITYCFTKRLEHIPADIWARIEQRQQESLAAQKQRQ